MSFENVIRANVALLKLSGTIRMGIETRRKIPLSRLLGVVSYSSLAIHSYCYASEFVNNADQIETAVESFALVVALFGGLVRYAIVYGSRDRIQAILEALDDTWDQLDPRGRRWVASYSKRAVRLTYFFLSQCFFTILFYAVSPLLVNFQTPRDDEGTSIVRALPYAFFVKVEASPYYEITYTLQILSMLNSGFTCVGVDMLGPILIMTLSGHLRAIREQFDDTEYGDENHLGKSTNSDQIATGYIVSRVIRHRNIISLSEEIEKLTNVVFFIQLLGSTSILSAVGFKLAGNDPDKFKYTTLIVIALVQLLVCNWPPDVLLTESSAVADSAYFAPWYEQTNEFQKNIWFVITRAQSPIRLSAGKFINLSLETFASMLSSAVSFFGVLSRFDQ